MCMHMGKQPIKGGHCYVLDYGLSFTLSLSPLRFLEDILHILHILFSARSLTFLGGYSTHFAYSVLCQVLRNKCVTEITIFKTTKKFLCIIIHLSCTINMSGLGNYNSHTSQHLLFRAYTLHIYTLCIDLIISVRY